MKKLEFTSFQLHIFAMVFMFIDHLSILFPDIIFLRIIGRLSFPIFAFMLVEGFFHTKNLKAYIGRLGLFMLLSELPFDLEHFSVKEISDNPFRLLEYQSIMCVFFISMIFIYILQKIKPFLDKLGFIGVSVFALLLGAILGEVLHLDYTYIGIPTVLTFFFTKGENILTKIFQGILLLVLSLCLLGCIKVPIGPILINIQVFSLGALFFIYNYKGKQGYHKKWFKYFCYAFYPMHLLILTLIKNILL